ncbi:integrase [Novosphingobium hassiacum]|uniref:Integrase n=1 Tax=Novosphingobium hassiacum TaxID=173676 RepID=A0A7W5ZZ86_9SPHN|nr:site-specific integrase [Novosphingobium hassiacum]MBB3862226.1 integrase [Novosphingobium hassiacum]
MGKLTVESVRGAKPGRHADGDGLYLLVKPTGARSWVLRVVSNGKRRDIGLGAVDLSPKSKKGEDEATSAIPLMLLRSLTLKQAREKASALRKIAHAGLDPIAERDRERRQIPTFAEAVDLAHAEFKKGWAVKHAAAFKASLETHVVPHIGRERVDVIDHAMVRDALASIWTDKPVMARKVRVRINQVLGFAKSKGWRKSDLPDAKEVRKGLAKHGRTGHFAAMPFKDAPAFVQALIGQDGTPGRLALIFTILTAARSGEVRNARWEQVDLDAATWTRPAEIMKMKVGHAIPLTPEAVAVLERAKALGNGKGLIFPGKGGKTSLSDMTLTKALRTAGQAQFTVHGFRSSFRDWAAEIMPTIPPMVAEMALAHSVGTETERAYLRSDLMDLRRTLMTAWAEYVTGKPAANVTPIKAAAA